MSDEYPNACKSYDRAEWQRAYDETPPYANLSLFWQAISVKLQRPWWGIYMYAKREGIPAKVDKQLPLCVCCRKPLTNRATKRCRRCWMHTAAFGPSSKHGVRLRQILDALRHADESLPSACLAGMLQISRQFVSLYMQRLCKRGLVQRVLNPRNKKDVRWALTKTTTDTAAGTAGSSSPTPL